MMNANDDEKWLTKRRYWDDLAASFDEEPDHGLHDAKVLASWTDFLKVAIPYDGAAVLDIGCGTGSLSVVLAGLGHQVTGIDLSPAMIALAQAKAAKLGLPITFQVMNAAKIQLPNMIFDTIVCRHLLWALPEPERVLRQWVELLKSKGRLILIEGYWGSGGGLHEDDVMRMLPTGFEVVLRQNLAANSDFLGKRVDDERYAIIAEKR